MKQVNEMPTNGSFVAIWIENDELKSETFIAYRDVICLGKMIEVRVSRDDMIKNLPDDTIFIV